MAMAQRRQRGMLDPDAKPGTSPFDHHVWVLASDGDLMEGVSGEASSLAGHQELGNLTVVYDANQISIEDDTDISFSEDVAMRYRAYGWDVVDVDWRKSNDPAGSPDYVEDVDALYTALVRSRSAKRPTLIRLHTVIAWPAPTKKGTGKSHGSALGDEEISATKQLLGFDPDRTFQVDRDVLAHARKVKARGKAAHREWDKGYKAWRKANAAARRRSSTGSSPARSPTASRRPLPSFAGRRQGDRDPGRLGQGPRRRSPRSCPSSGAGPPTSPSPTTRRWRASRPSSPRASRPHEWQGGPYGRTLHFGIREFAMGLILNGIALEGLTRPYGGTFLVFSDYMRASVRLACIQQAPVTFVWTHDSIGLGEDGPTHQPIEHLASLRAHPRLRRRPPGRRQRDRGRLGGRSSSAAAPGRARALPAGPADDRARQGRRGLDGRRRQGRLRPRSRRARPTPDVILVATGSEVQLAVSARETLEASGRRDPRRVDAVRRVVRRADRRLPGEGPAAAVRARVAVEAGVPRAGASLVGDAGEVIGIDHFGASRRRGHPLPRVRVHGRQGRRRGSRSLKAAGQAPPSRSRSRTAPTPTSPPPETAKTAAKGSDRR